MTFTGCAEYENCHTVSQWYMFLGIFWVVLYSVHCMCFHLLLIL